MQVGAFSTKTTKSTKSDKSYKSEYFNKHRKRSDGRPIVENNSSDPPPRTIHADHLNGSRKSFQAKRELDSVLDLLDKLPAKNRRSTKLEFDGYGPGFMEMAQTMGTASLQDLRAAVDKTPRPRNMAPSMFLPVASDGVPDWKPSEDQQELDKLLSPHTASNLSNAELDKLEQWNGFFEEAQRVRELNAWVEHDDALAEFPNEVFVVGRHKDRRSQDEKDVRALESEDSLWVR